MTVFSGFGKYGIVGGGGGVGFVITWKYACAW